MVYNIDPMGGAVRDGNWKLVWTAALPQRVELFDLGANPAESTNLADSNPEKVKEWQDRITALAKEMAPPLLLMEAIKLTFGAPPVTADPATIFSAGD